MKRVGININESKDKDGIIFNETVKTLKENASNIEIYKIATREDVVDKDLDMILVFGGDGTILRAGREFSQYKDTPILGINIGHLGFLSTIEYDEFKENISKILKNNFRIEKRLMLKSFIKGSGSDVVLYSLNDLVVCRGTLSRMAKYKIKINGDECMEFKGDGVIISTPTGSTAYSFSAGGPIVYPTLRQISITPICPHSPSLRTIIIDENSEITITASANDSILYASTDGQKFNLLENDFELTVRKAERDCNLIMLKEVNYYDVLKSKIINI